MTPLTVTPRVGSVGDPVGAEEGVVVGDGVGNVVARVFQEIATGPRALGPIRLCWQTRLHQLDQVGATLSHNRRNVDLTAIRRAHTSLHQLQQLLDVLLDHVRSEQEDKWHE